MNTKKILVLSKDTRYIAGVANFVRLFMERWREVFGNEYRISLFVQGKYYAKWKNYFLFVLYPYQYLKFTKILKGKNIELVHLNPSMGPVPMWRDGLYLRIAKKMGIKTIFFIRGWDDNYFQNRVRRGTFSKIHQKTLKMADAIIVLSPEFKEKLIESGISPEKIFILTTMVESSKFYPGNKDFSPPYRLLFCSRIVKEKGIYETIGTLNILINNNKRKDIELTVVGDGKDLAGVKEYVRKLNLERYVKFTGYLVGEEKYKAYKSSHIFVFPSYTEGFPNVVLEAMAAGLVIVTTPVGGLKYAFKEKHNGLFINTIPPDPKEIAEKIEYLLSNPNVMKEISNHNIFEAKTKYDVQVVISKIKEIYEKVLEEDK